DDSMSAVDSETDAAIRKSLLSLRRGGITFLISHLITTLRERLHVTSVVVTHDLELCFAISDRVGLLGRGRLLAVGTPEEIRASGLPEVREFLAGDLDAKKDLWSGGAGPAPRRAPSGGE
ncbi:MAG TPA: hypothetical protein PLW10_19950, partial [Myxococcota bacterium]|nr:hypothetical protein [Myxococcota bacterium]